MALEPPPERRGSFGPTVTYHLISGEQPAPLRELVLQRGGGGRPVVRGAENALRPRHKPVHLRLFSLERHGTQRAREPLGELLHRPRRRLASRLYRNSLHRERIAEMEQRDAAERLLGPVMQTRRHDLERQGLRQRRRCAERNTGGARLEWP